MPLARRNDSGHGKVRQIRFDSIVVEDASHEAGLGNGSAIGPIPVRTDNPVYACSGVI